MTQPRKTASEWAKEIMSQECDRTAGRAYCYVHKNDGCPDMSQLITKALEQYLLQESGELVKSLEKIAGFGQGHKVSDAIYEAHQALNTFRSRHK